MAAGNAEPRGRIPDHPPYSLMIGEAIRSLNEEQGSTEPSISEYIKANFDGLPWGHDRLLPYYLNKLVAQGEFVNGDAGRYLLVDDDGGCDAGGGRTANSSPENVPEGRGEFAKKKRSRDGVGIEPLQSVPSTAIRDGDLDEDEGVPIACEGDLVIEIQPLAGPETCKSDASHENRRLTVSNTVEASSESMPKRCGRPPKGRQPSTGKPAVTSKPTGSDSDDFEPVRASVPGKEHPLMHDEAGTDCALVQSELTPTDCKFDAAGSESAHRGRGRPPKRRKFLMHGAIGSVPDNFERLKASTPEKELTSMHGEAEKNRVLVQSVLPPTDCRLDAPGSESVHKTRGRLPKIRHSESANLLHSYSLGTEDDALKPRVLFDDRDAVRMAQNEEDGPKETPRKLRRPPKKRSSKEVVVHDGGVNELQPVDLLPSCTDDLRSTATPNWCRVRRSTCPCVRHAKIARNAKIGDVSASTRPCLLPCPCLLADDGTRNTNDNSKSAPKRRGNQPKTNNEDVETMHDRNPSTIPPLSRDVQSNPTEEQANNGAGSKPTPKKLGGALKTAYQNGGHVDLLRHVDPKLDVMLQEEGRKETDPMPEHHGSPSKSEPEVVAQSKNPTAEMPGRSEATESMCAPKRRGRPPKSKPGTA